MKNLIVPFIMMALLAIGSCGDEPVQPTVNNPIDTTEKQDTTDKIVPIKLKELKGMYVSSIPAIMVRTSAVYEGSGAGGSYRETKRDTVKATCGRNFYPYFNGKPGNVYVSHYDSTKNSYIFTWINYSYGPRNFLDSLIFTVDTVKKELHDIVYKSYYEESNSGLGGSNHFYIKLKSARYEVKNNNLSILFSNGLKNAIEKFNCSSGNSYYRSGYYYDYSIGLDTNSTSGTFNLQIALE